MNQLPPEICLHEKTLPLKNYAHHETLFTLGNGLLGVRGGFEEGPPVGCVGPSYDGVYLNGYFESASIEYPEFMYGQAAVRETIAKLPSTKRVVISIDGEDIQLSDSNVIEYSRSLNSRNGTCLRDFTVQMSGKQVRVKITRLVSFLRPHLLATHFEILPIDFSGVIGIRTEVDGGVENRLHGKDPRVGAFFQGSVYNTDFLGIHEGIPTLVFRTKQSGFPLGCAVYDQCSDVEMKYEVDEAHRKIRGFGTADVTAGESVSFVRYTCYLAERTTQASVSIPDLHSHLLNARSEGFVALMREQEEFLKSFWEHSQVEIAGDVLSQQAIDFNLFQLLQSLGRDGASSIASKGVTGEGYEGHIFWDAEIYIFPVFLYTNPNLARGILEFRFGKLSEARLRAQELDHQGALFPWRTISGQELSPYFPGGTAQYHINADIMYAVKQYYHATDDVDFMVDKGIEMLVESARFYLSLGSFIEGKGFCIHCVTGPDEYTALVDNNLYTNLMVSDHLKFAAEITEEFLQREPTRSQVVLSKLNFRASESEEWKRAADNIFLPFDTEKGLYGQDENFLEKPLWDWRTIPKGKRPLLMHYHYLNIYRHQIVKQPDLVLALFLQGENFSLDEKKKNYLYYEDITIHDSSLSFCVHGIIASEIGLREQAEEYFLKTVRLDLDDIHGNTCDGIHSPAMAGSWMGIAFGFAGMRQRRELLEFSPFVPANWESYSFNLVFRGGHLEVCVENDSTTYINKNGEAIRIVHYGEEYLLERTLSLPNKNVQKGDERGAKAVGE